MRSKTDKNVIDTPEGPIAKWFHTSDNPIHNKRIERRKGVSMSDVEALTKKIQ
jgi:hypothetical protein